MDWMTIGGFFGATLLLLLTPGPIMAVVVGSTLNGGVPAGLRTVLGIGFGEALMIGGASACLLTSSTVFSDAFPWLSLLSALYLIWLALKVVRSRAFDRDRDRPATASHRPFLHGLLITLSSPTAPLFYAAFLLPFVDNGDGLAIQLWTLAFIYVLASVIFDLACVVLVSRFRSDAVGGGIIRRAAPALIVVVYVATSMAALHAFVTAA